MGQLRAAWFIAIVVSVTPLAAFGQSPVDVTTAVPKVITITGVVKTADGIAAGTVESVTLSIYADPEGGTPLWQETQQVTLDDRGRYTVVLGAAHADGIPASIFAAGGQWLGTFFERPGEVEGPRVRLTSVPYAMRAAEADTLGGHPASDYVLATGGAGDGKAAATAASRPDVAGPAGTVNFLPKYVDTVNLGDSALYESGGMIGLGTTMPFDVFHVRYTNTGGNLTGFAVQNLGNTATSYSGMLFYDQNGALGQFQGFNNVTHEYRINNIAPSGSINFMIGSSSKLRIANNGDIDISNNITKNGSLFLHTTGGFATFVGPNAGNNTVTGGGNTAVGYGALNKNTTGASNTAIGLEALSFNTEGSLNTAVGQAAVLTVTTASENTGIGADALLMTTGCCNTAVGAASLDRNTTGTFNTALGQFAGELATTGSNNIYIGANVLGIAGESNTMYLGVVGTQTKSVIAGVRGITTGAANAVSVVIDSNGQLGTINSSRRYKEDINDMGDASSGLMNLRPVTFRYKQAYTDGSKPLDYGLIAEEVEEVYPNLVTHAGDGTVETVQYHKINAMLLNEVQKQHRLLQEQRSEIELLKARLGALEQRKQ
jgi:hypothetical protein